MGWGNFGFSSNFTAIHEAAALGLRTLLKVSPMFWERTNGAHSMLRLRDDYLCVPIHCTHARAGQPQKGRRWTQQTTCLRRGTEPNNGLEQDWAS